MKNLTRIILTSSTLALLSCHAFADEKKPTPVKLDRASQVQQNKVPAISGLARAVMPGNLLAAPAKVEAHRGGNGGEDLELTLKKTALQIAHFVKSTMGSKVFNMVNADTLIATTNSMDVDVVSEPVMDKYGAIRTCVNEPERSLITCNSLKISELIRQQKNDVLTAIVFHEILGLMGVELGYQENVSMYPISSKIIPYHNVVASTQITEGQIRPEYYGLDHRSYGVTLKNKSTGETLRVICLNDNVEVHRCRNYSVVRSANKAQAPLVPEVVSVSSDQLYKILDKVTIVGAKELQENLEQIQAKGYKFLSVATHFRGKNDYTGDHYRFGFGWTQMGMTYQDGIGPGYLFTALGDSVFEVTKQGLNVVVYPFKATANAIRSVSTKRRLKKLNKKLHIVKLVTNSSRSLSLLGTTKSVSDEDFNFACDVLSVALMTTISVKQ